MADAPRQQITHKLDRAHGGADGYSLTCTGLTRAEVIELLVVMRRLDLFRVMEVDADTVENGARTMAQFEVEQNS